MNTHDKYELPAEFRSGNNIPVERATITRERMLEILQAAIEADRKRTTELLKNPVHVHTNMCRGIIAPITFDMLAHVLGEEATQAWLNDRQRRGEPVGYIFPTALRQLKSGGHAVVGGASQGGDVPLYTAPQPAEPVKYCTHPICRGAGTTCTGVCSERFAAPQPAEPVNKTDWNTVLSSWSDDDFVRVFHERPDLADRLRKMLSEPVKHKRQYAQGTALGEFGIIPMCDQVDDEPVKVPSSFPTGTEYSVEPHGNGYAIYQGRDQFHHGLNLAHLTECTPEFSKRIESALNATREPVKVPSDLPVTEQEEDEWRRMEKRQ